MTLDNTTFRNLAITYFAFYGDNTEINKYALPEIKEASQKLALKILRFFNIKVTDNIASYRKLSLRDPFLHGGKVAIPYSCVFGDITLQELRDIEDILNDPVYETTWKYLSPLFDSIGWILSDSSGRIKINFVGSATYEIWKDEQFYF